MPITDTSKKVRKITVGTEVMEIAREDITSGEYFIKVIDYDGTVLKEANLNTGDTFTLPDAPSHEGLVFQEWSCSQEIVDNTITITDNNVMVGATYTTASGLNEFDIEITKAMVEDIATNGYTVTLNMDGNKWWGYNKDKVTSDTANTHTFYEYGKYTIACDGTTMTTSNSSGLFGQNTSDANYYCINVRFSNITSITNYAFNVCYGLKSIIIPNSISVITSSTFTWCQALKQLVIPSSVTKINSSAFQYCKALTSIVIPNSVTALGEKAFSYCTVLKNIIIPNSVTSVNSNCFAQCTSLTKAILSTNLSSTAVSMFEACSALTEINIPNNVTILNQRGFYGCASLKKVIIPNNVTTIENNMFVDCYSLTSLVIPNSVSRLGNAVFSSSYALSFIDFSTHTTVPTLAGSSLISNKIAKIIVPDALYDEWIAATNWATYADYIYKASEVNV